MQSENTQKLEAFTEEVQPLSFDNVKVGQLVYIANGTLYPSLDVSGQCCEVIYVNKDHRWLTAKLTNFNITITQLEFAQGFARFVSADGVETLIVKAFKEAHDLATVEPKMLSSAQAIKVENYMNLKKGCMCKWVTTYSYSCEGLQEDHLDKVFGEALTSRILSDESLYLFVWNLISKGINDAQTLDCAKRSFKERNSGH